MKCEVIYRNISPEFDHNDPRTWLDKYIYTCENPNPKRLRSILPKNIMIGEASFELVEVKVLDKVE